MNLNLIDMPLVEPLNIFEVFGYLRINSEHCDDNESFYISSLITASRKYCENYQNRVYITQVWEMYLDEWPPDVIKIPKGKLQAINSIKYKDSSSVETTLANTEYVYSAKGMYGRLTPAYGKLWPSFTAYPLDAITINFTCGYGSTSDDVPETVKQAMYLLISHWYENRVPLNDRMGVPSELDFTITALLWQERIVNV